MVALRRTVFMIPLLLLAFTACSSTRSPSAAGSPPSSVAPSTIVIKNFAFSPGTITVAANATITVHNEDGTTHTVTATGKEFDTGDIPGGAVRTFTAPSKPGRYPYICEIHQYMTGTLVVS